MEAGTSVTGKSSWGDGAHCCSQTLLGRRHSPGYALPPFQLDRSGSAAQASRADSIPEGAAVGNFKEPHLNGRGAGPMGSHEVLLQVRHALKAGQGATPAATASHVLPALPTCISAVGCRRWVANVWHLYVVALVFATWPHGLVLTGTPHALTRGVSASPATLGPGHGSARRGPRP